MIQVVSRAVDAVTRLMLVVASAIVLALVALINVEIVSRYFLNTSTLIADEYGGYALVWICLLGFSQALRSDQFLSVDAFVQRLPPLGQRVSIIAGALVGFCVAALLTYATYRLAASNLRFGTVSIQPSGTPLWIPQSILPVGFGWLCVVYVQIIVNAIAGNQSDEGGA